MCHRMTSCFGHIVDERRHGFLKGRSVVTNLADFVSGIVSKFERGLQVGALYLDFNKAFESLNYQLLAEKMRRYGADTVPTIES